MRARITAATLAAAAGLALAQVSWDGDCNNVWESFCSGGTVSNWSTDTLPTAADSVVINGADVRINSTAGPQVVNSMELTSGILTGWVAVLDGASISNSDFTGTFESVGTTSFSGTCVVSGTLRGPGFYATSGSWTFNDSFIGEPAVPTSITNVGLMRLNFEPDLREGSTIINSGALEFGSRGIVGLGTVVSSGTLRKVDPGAAFMGTQFSVTGGTIDVQQGELRFTNQNTFSGGTASVASGALLNFAGINVEHDFDGLSQIAGQGEMRFSSGPSLGNVVNAPLALNMTAPGKASLGLRMEFNDTLTNQGIAEFDSVIAIGFGAAGGTGYVNESGATTTVLFSANPNLLLDSDIINRGDFVQLSPIDRFSVASINITNEPGGVWDALATPAAMVRFDNRGIVYRRSIAGRVVADGSFAGEFDMTDGIVICDGDANTFFNGGGSWGGTSLLSASSSAGAYIASEILISPGTTTFQTAPTGIIGITQNNAGTNLTVEGTLCLDGQPSDDPFSGEGIVANDEIVGPGTIINKGNLTLFDNADLGDASNLGTFTNNKNLVINAFGGTGVSCSMDLTNNADVYQLDDLTLGGSPTINNGTWTIASGGVGAGTDLENFGGPFPFTNHGLFIAERDLGGDGGVARVNIDFDNQGTVYVTNDMTLSFFGGVAQIVGGALAGGTWIVEPTGFLQLPGPISVIAPGTTLVGGSSTIPVLEQIETLEGELYTNSPLAFDTQLEIDNGGVLHIGRNGPVFSPGPVTNAPPVNGILNETRLSAMDPDTDQRVGDPCPTLPDLQASSFDNHSALDPGPEGEILGARIAAPTTLHASSILRVDLAGSSPCELHDQIVIDGPAVLGGTVEVRLAVGYAPQPADTYTIVSASSGVTGAFDAIDAPAAAPGMRFGLIYGANDATLVLTCFADCDTNGTLNFDDIDCFVSGFLAGDLAAADCDANGTVNLDDLDCFVSGFLGGCP